VYEDLCLEREIRNDTTRRFKNENGRLVELPPRDPFNHTQNRETLIRELDPRIEWGMPTEYDKGVESHDLKPSVLILNRTREM
jgi:hypothetical protein